jgi:hypothetical protein
LRKPGIGAQCRACVDGEACITIAARARSVQPTYWEDVCSVRGGVAICSSWRQVKAFQIIIPSILIPGFVAKGSSTADAGGCHPDNLQHAEQGEQSQSVSNSAGIYLVHQLQARKHRPVCQADVRQMIREVTGDKGCVAVSSCSERW